MAKQFDTIDNWLEYINNNNISMNNPKNTVLVENIKASKNSYPQDNDNAVHFHTMHSCKGLEYKVVFIMDVVEGIIPYNKAVLDYEIEEERRLMYVAMTRAKEKLYLLYAKSRYNKDTNHFKICYWDRWPLCWLFVLRVFLFVEFFIFHSIKFFVKCIWYDFIFFIRVDIFKNWLVVAVKRKSV